jgi:hypothetical protein
MHVQARLEARFALFVENLECPSVSLAVILQVATLARA